MPKTYSTYTTVNFWEREPANYLRAAIILLTIDFE